jgi:NADP-dependent alcohol dehydrogenase
MNDFSFHNPTKILFGKDTHKQIGHELTACGIQKVLFLYGTGSIKTIGLYDDVITTLHEEGITSIECSGVVSNPVLSHARDAVALAKEHQVDAILSVGGGSVLDEAKAIAAGALAECDVWEFYTGKTIEKALPVFSILTLAASGSEMNGNSVLTNEFTQEKFSFNSIHAYPKVSCLNPELTFSVDPAYTAYGAVDAISHVIEGYFTQKSGAHFQDRLAESIIKSVIESTNIIMKEPNNYQARAEMMWAASMALNGLPQIGLEGTQFPNHMIEHSLSALYNIAHGAGLAIVIPAWMKWYHEQKPERFERFAKEVFGLHSAHEGIDALQAWFSAIGAPVSLHDANISADDIAKITQNACVMAKAWGQDDNYGPEEIEAILRLA